MSKHTPGPWHLETAHNSVKSLTGEDLNQTVHSVKGPIAYLDDSETTGPRYERDANARLIAAAPDLLVALQAVLESSNLSPGDCYNHDGTPNALWGSIDRAKAAARAAIAKATVGDL